MLIIENIDFMGMMELTKKDRIEIAEKINKGYFSGIIEKKEMKK